MAEASEVKIEKAERRSEIVVEARHVAEETQVAAVPPPLETSPEEPQMAGPPTEVTLNGISNFLAEHHTYLAQNTMAMIAAMRQELAEEYERKLAAQEQAHAWALAENEATLAEQQRQLQIAQHSLERLIVDRESANWTTAARFRDGKRQIGKRAIFKAWAEEARSAKADRLLCRVADKLYEKNLAAKSFTAWVRLVWGSREDRNAKAAETRLRAVTAEIINRYEAELSNLRAHVDALQKDVAHGKRQRAVLKDELRRTLLKGMVSMNMEALNIFSHDQSSSSSSENTAPDEAALWKALAADEAEVGSSNVVPPAAPLPRSVAPRPFRSHNGGLATD